MQIEQKKLKGKQQVKQIIPITDAQGQKRKSELVHELKKKEARTLGLDKPVTRQGFLKFASYESKLRMMDTALFLFGMKLHR